MLKSSLQFYPYFQSSLKEYSMMKKIVGVFKSKSDITKCKSETKFVKPEEKYKLGEPFDFSEEMKKKVVKILSKYPKEEYGFRSGVIPLLDLAQQQLGGFVTLNAMKRISEICNCAEREVYEVANFYAMFNSKPVGKYHIHVCRTTPCMISGADDILGALEKKLDIKIGETTKDGMFTINHMECMGCCVNAPMIAIADYSNPPNFSYNYYEDLTPKRALEIIDLIYAGKKIPVGSQIKKFTEPKNGRTTLKEEIKPVCRDIEKC